MLRSLDTTTTTETPDPNESNGEPQGDITTQPSPEDTDAGADDAGDKDTDDSGDVDEDELEDVKIETESLLEENRRLSLRETFFCVCEDLGVSESTLVMAREMGLFDDTALGTMAVESLAGDDVVALQAALEEAVDQTATQSQSWGQKFTGFLGNVASKFGNLFKAAFDGVVNLAKGTVNLVTKHPIATVITVVGAITGGAAIAKFALGGGKAAVASEEAAMTFFGKIAEMFRNIQLPDGGKIMADVGKFGSRMRIKFITARKTQGLASAVKGGAVDAAKGVRGVGKAAMATSATLRALVGKVSEAAKFAWDCVVDLPRVIARQFGTGAVAKLDGHQAKIARAIYEKGGKKIMSRTTAGSIVRFVEANVAFIALTSLVKIVWRNIKKFVKMVVPGSPEAPAATA